MSLFEHFVIYKRQGKCEYGIETQNQIRRQNKIALPGNEHSTRDA